MKDPSYVFLGKKKLHRSWIMLIACSCLAIGYLAVIFGANGNFIVAICTETGIPRSQLAVWQQVHYLSTAVFIPVYARFYDKVNIRLLLSIAACGCILGSLLMSFYTEWWQWILSGFLFGSVGAGLMYLPQAVILGNWFGNRIGLGLGICTAVASLAVVVTSPAFAMLIENFGWRTSYIFQACTIAVLTLPFTLFVIVRSPSDINAKPLGCSNKDIELERGNGQAIVKGVPFKKGLFSVPFIMLFIFSGMSALIGSGFDAHMPGFAVSVGFSPIFGSLLLSALFAGSFVEKLVMGWLNDKIGVQRTVFVELSLIVLGILGLIFFRNEILMLGSTFIFGTQDSLMSLALPLLVRSFFGDLDFTRLYAWASVGAGILGSFGSPLVGLSYDLTGSFIPASWIACGLCILGVGCIVVARLNVKKLEIVEELR